MQVTASNLAGRAAAAVTIAVLSPPAGLSYAYGDEGAAVAYGAGAPAEPNRVDRLDGTGPFAFAVEPALPAGLALDPATGEIAGTAAAAAAAGVYRVTASNAVGSTTCSLVIEANPLSLSLCPSIYLSLYIYLSQPPIYINLFPIHTTPRRVTHLPVGPFFSLASLSLSLLLLLSLSLFHSLYLSI